MNFNLCLNMSGFSSDSHYMSYDCVFENFLLIVIVTVLLVSLPVDWYRLSSFEDIVFVHKNSIMESW